MVTLGSMAAQDSELAAFAARLNWLCDRNGVPPKGKNRQAAVAQIFEVSQKGARKWLEGEGWPTRSRMVRIALWAGCTYEWLQTGRGEPFADDRPYDQATTEMVAAMQRLPQYLKPLAVRQVQLLLDLEHEPPTDSEDG